jgi:hypothetical protein
MPRFKLSVSTVLGLLAVAAAAHAGVKSSQELTTYRDSYGGYFRGSFGLVRNSADQWQYLDCETMVYPDGRDMACAARDINGNSAYAWTDETYYLIDAMRSLNGDSRIYVAYDTSGEITYLSVTNGSQYAPKQP